VVARRFIVVELQGGETLTNTLSPRGGDAYLGSGAGSAVMR